MMPRRDQPEAARRQDAPGRGHTEWGAAGSSSSRPEPLDMDNHGGARRNAPTPTPTTWTFQDEPSPTESQEKAASNSAPGPSSPGLIARAMDRLSGGCRRLAQKLGLNSIMLRCMFKGSVAPAIAISIYQAESIKNMLTTLGYLVGVVSVLALAILPRGKFIQNMTLNLVCACVGSAMGMLIAWSSVQARLNTSDPQELARYIAQHGRAPYNASQSAVCGVWLTFNVWAANTVRAKFPAFNLPIIIYCILVMVASTTSPQLFSVARAESFIRELIIAVFLGLAIGTGCSLFIFPISTRQMVVRQMAGVLGLFKKAISLEKDYLQGLEKDDMFHLELTETSAGRPQSEIRKGDKKNAAPRLTQEQKTALALRGTIAASRELMGKIYGDLKFAKRDVAWGYLSARDFGRLYNLIRDFMIPMTGIGVIMDIFQKVGKERGWDGNGIGLDAPALQPDANEPLSPGHEFDKDESQRVWNDIMKQLHEPFEILSDALIQGIDHAGILLRFFPQPQEQKKAAAQEKSGTDADVEAAGDDLRPGQLGFSRLVKAKIDTFKSRKGEILWIWAKDKGLSSDGKHWDECDTHLFEKRRNDQAQLFVILYLETLMQATAEAVYEFVAFAEEKRRDGSIAKKHLVIPSWRRIKKWLVSIFKNHDSTADNAPDILERGGNVVFVGQGWMNKKDPEHLPPTNVWQRLGNGLRDTSNFFGSSESMFGLRVACATMTVGIVAFLEQSQHFFTQQRLVWAMIIIAIGMTQTSGQSIFGYVLRVVGTFIAMVSCFIIWYIVDYRTPGVLVFLWLFIFIDLYFFFKFPQFVPAVMLCIVTQILIIGYELQVRSLGVAAAESSGQPYYPLYLLAPYRLATVVAGLLIAFFWTVFPRPFTDRTWLRKDLSATLYLLANFSSVTATTMRATLAGTAGDLSVPGTPAHTLFTMRRKLFGKLMLLLPSLQAHANFQKFGPSIGGKFPEEQYQDIIHRATRINNYFTLMSYILTWTSKSSPTEDSDREWMRVLSKVLNDTSYVHMQMLSTLTLLSNAMHSGHSLPPYMPLPQPFEMTRHLLSIPMRRGQHQPGRRGSDASVLSPSALEPEAWNLLDARNMEQKGYTEFAVMQVCSTLIIGELRGLVRTVGDLVGTVDFSFRVEEENIHDVGVSAVAAASGSDTSMESVVRTGTWASRHAERDFAASAPASASASAKGKGKSD